METTAYTVTCLDGTETGGFESFAAAEQWADWGHACLAYHEVGEAR